MMELVRTILAELARPDDQGRDWYGWCTNQISHVALGSLGGVTVALALAQAGFAVPLGVPALVFAGAKEGIDIARRRTRRTVRDSVYDLLFMQSGVPVVAALIESDPSSAIVWLAVIASGLLAGVWSKVRA